MKLTLIMFVGLAIACMLGSGCTSTRPNLVKTGQVRLEVAPRGRYAISRAYVYHEEGRLAVHGHIRDRRYASRYVQADHVHIQILDRDGRCIEQKAVPISSRLHGRRSSVKPRFTGRFNLASISGVTVRVWPHDGNITHCRGKAALPENLETLPEQKEASSPDRSHEANSRE
jgi:hypothetical protein